jgi:hypothetical protein
VPDGRLSISITHSDGRVTRLGPDEVDAKNIPQGLTFGTQMPGGYATCGLSLLVRIDLETPIELFDDVSVYGPGGETAWEGRVTQLPRSHGDAYGMSPAAVGWSSHLKDDPSFAEVYVDRDPSMWGEPPFNRRASTATVGEDRAKIAAGASTGGLVWDLPNEALGTSASTELFYVAPTAVAAAKIMYQGNSTSPPAGIEAPTLTAGDTDTLGGSITHALTLDDTLRSQTLSSAKKYLMLRAKMASAGTPAAGAQIRYSKIAVYGNHGLTTRAITGDPDGLYASDVLPDILTRAAPELSYTTGADGSITPSSFAIPHLVFRGPVTADQAILAVNAYHAYEWGVYDNREFFWRPTDPDRVCWEARLSEGAHLDLEGQAADGTYNGVFGSFTDPTGVQNTFGPPGSDADVEDALLEDASEDNPVNKHGLRRWGPEGGLALSQITTDEGAVQLAGIWLAEQAVPQRRGSIRVTGCIEHPTRGKRPVWAVKAGDYVRISDHPNDQPRRIISTSYTHDSRQLVMDVGTIPHKLDALMARLEAYRTGRY